MSGIYSSDSQSDEKRRKEAEVEEAHLFLFYIYLINTEEKEVPEELKEAWNGLRDPANAGLNYKDIKERYLSPNLGVYQAHIKADLLKAMEKNPAIAGYVDLTKRMADRCNIDGGILVNQLWQESRFKPEAGSWVGARGIGQFMAPTWDSTIRNNREAIARHLDALGDTDMAQRIRNREIPDRGNARLSIVAAAVHMEELTLKYEKQGFKNPQVVALIAYNAGAGAVQDLQAKLGRNFSIDDVQNYWAQQRASGVTSRNSRAVQTSDYLTKIAGGSENLNEASRTLNNQFSSSVTQQNPTFTNNGVVPVIKPGANA